MSAPLYVPVLPVRDHAARAYRSLAPAVQQSVAPLWTLPPHTGVPGTELRTRLDRILRQVVRAQAHRSAWLDAPFADAADEDTEAAAVSAEALRLRWTASPLRPVTGPDRPPVRQELAADAAREGGNGLGVRVPVPGEWDDAVAERIRGLLKRLDSAVRADLLLDLGTVAARPDAAKEALRALDALFPLVPWRTVAVLAGGYPDNSALDAMWHRGRAEPDRTDRETWRQLTRTGRPWLRHVHYGDYGPFTVESIAAEHRGGGGPPWGMLRYTTDRTWLVARVPTGGLDRAERIRAAARWLVESGAWRGPLAGAGDTWLRDCAHGTGGDGTGNAGTWNRAAHAQHMSHVVTELHRAAGEG